MTTAVLDGRPCAVTGSWDGMVRVWDLATGEEVGQPIADHDGRVRVWDRATREQIGEPICHAVWEVPVATAVLDGRAVAVVGGRARPGHLARGGRTGAGSGDPRGGR